MTGMSFEAEQAKKELMKNDSFRSDPEPESAK